MSLFKKIGKAMAIGALTLGMAYNISADPNETSKEAARYKNLFMIEESSDPGHIVFRWKRSGEECNARCIYERKRMKDEEISILKLEKAYEDRNRDGNFDENEIVKGEYNQFKIMGISKDFVMIGKDEDNDAVIDKTYTYRKKKESPTIKQFVLYNIRKDMNNNQKFEDDEIIWQNWLDF